MTTDTLFDANLLTLKYLSGVFGIKRSIESHAYKQFQFQFQFQFISVHLIR